jgi:methionine synthase II (cobalamin-independent)
VALSLSDWDVSSGPYAWLSQMPVLGRDLAKTTAKLVEHPELVADRLITFAEVVGQESVIAGTDRGLGGRVHPQIAWAKLRALRDGAAIASKKLWS